MDVDQHQVAPNSRQDKVRLVMIKPPFRLIEAAAYRQYNLPVIMLVGYAAHADDFDTTPPDFEGFLQRLTIAGKHGASFAASVKGTAVSPAQQPEPAAPSPTPASDPAPAPQPAAVPEGHAPQASSAPSS